MTGFKVTYVFNGALDIVYFTNRDVATQWANNFNGSLEEIWISTIEGVQQ